MAAYDIMPASSPHGGLELIRHYRLNAAETFQVGEPVSVNADGEVTESADDPVDADLMGIALAPGADPSTGTAFVNPVTGAAYATGAMIPVVIPGPHTLFRTENYSEAGAAFNDTAPVVARVGDEAGLSLIAGSWGIDISAANNTCRIVDILDPRGRSIQQTGATVSTSDRYTVIFQIVAHQSVSLGAADAPVA